MNDQPDHARRRHGAASEERVADRGQRSGEGDPHPSPPTEGVAFVLVALFFALVFGAIALAIVRALEGGWP